ncbi:MAG: hypothetical protein ACI808_001596 [Paraglaciecola sp.]|jgi:hypothetical protein
MSKDLRFNKEDFSISDEVESIQLYTNEKIPKHIQADVKYRSREFHLRRSVKRSLVLENEV